MADLKYGQVEITCRDHEGETETKVIEENDYCVIVTGSMRITHLQRHANGTVQMTLKKGDKDGA